MGQSDRQVRKISRGFRRTSQPKYMGLSRFLKRTPTPSLRLMVDNSKSLTPPWRIADTNSKLGKGPVSRKGKGVDQPKGGGSGFRGPSIV